MRVENLFSLAVLGTAFINEAGAFPVSDHLSVGTGSIDDLTLDRRQAGLRVPAVLHEILTGTWVENLVIRQSESNTLATILAR